MEFNHKSVLFEETIDANGLYICPGFVDIHTHGGYGSDFMESNREAFTSRPFFTVPAVSTF